MARHLFVYILKCADDSYYIGVTNNVERRFEEHVSGLNETCYTYSRRSLELMFQKEFQSPREAIAFEKQIKGWTRAKKEALIIGDIEKLKELSRSKN
ncbi:MAG: GIY-YIG nuclease family protein [Bacteroidota bacterium]|nr:GIY-YIG nuclease family protein [Bacteroidota bacterium]